MVSEVIAVLCVLGITIGQLMFKFGANLFEHTGSYFSLKPAIVISIALAIYGLSTLAWIWVLQKTDLGRVYPLMALAFILVPLGSYVFFHEKFSTQYLFGLVFIVLGIYLAVRS